MVCVRLLTNPRANKFGRYPTFFATPFTFSRTAGVILESSFKARETVVGEMFKYLAMSLIVMLMVAFCRILCANVGTQKRRSFPVSGFNERWILGAPVVRTFAH